MTKGYKRTEYEPQNQECPTPEQVLEHVLKRASRKPKMFPADPFQAARYWMAHQEQADDFTEGAQPPSSKGGQWITPYHDRVAHRLQQFLWLKHIHQLYIIENVEAGTPWRGDDVHFYMEVVKQTEKMKADKHQFIEQALTAMKKLSRNLTNDRSRHGNDADTGTNQGDPGESERPTTRADAHDNGTEHAGEPDGAAAQENP